MIINSFTMSDQYINRTTINILINVLHDSLKKDLTLTSDLLLFLKEHNITIPPLGQLSSVLPTSLINDKTDGRITKVKNSLAGLEISENIL